MTFRQIFRAWFTVSCAAQCRSPGEMTFVAHERLGLEPGNDVLGAVSGVICGAHRRCPTGMLEPLDPANRPALTPSLALMDQPFAYRASVRSLPRVSTTKSMCMDRLIRQPTTCILHASRRQTCRASSLP